MPPVRWMREPTEPRPTRVPLENLALVPASLLPQKVHYQRLANQLPPGAILIVLPTEAGPEQDALKAAADRFLAKGHPVSTITADVVLAQARKRPATRQRAQAEPVPSAPASAVGDEVASVPLSVPKLSLPTALPAGEVPAFTHELRLVQLDASQRRARFSVFQWQPTLFAGMALVEVQGQLGRTGHARVLLHMDTPQLDARLTKRVQRRLQAGYQIVDWQ